MSDIDSRADGHRSTDPPSRKHVDANTSERLHNPRVAAFRSLGRADEGSAPADTAHTGVKRMRPREGEGISDERAMHRISTSHTYNSHTDASDGGHEGPAEKPTSSRPAHVDTARVESESTAKRPKLVLDADSEKRSKRMFGALLGHLSKAKTTLESEPVQRRIIQQQQQQAAAVEHDSKRRAHESEAAALVARRLREESLQQREAAQLEVQKSDLATLSERMKRAIAEEAQASASFLLTDTLPALCWWPAEPGKDFQDLLAKQQVKMAPVYKHREASITEWKEGRAAELEKELARKRSRRQEHSSHPTPPQAVHTSTATEIIRELHPISDVKHGLTADGERVSSSEGDQQQSLEVSERCASPSAEVAAKKDTAHDDDLLDYGHD